MPLVLIHKASKKPKSKPRATLSAERYEPALRTAFRTNIGEVLTDAQVKRLGRAVRDHDAAAAVQFIPAGGDKKGGWGKMRSAFEANYKRIIGAAAHETVASAGLGFTFDVDQTHVINWIDAKGAKMVTDISDDARNNIKAIVRSGSTDGLTVEQQARLVKPLIGLSQPHARAVENRLKLHIDAGMDEELASKKAGAYAEDLLNLRARTIAQQETMVAQNYGKRQTFNQARDMGILGDNPTKTWVGSEFESSDHGACRACANLNGMTIPLDEKFPGGKKYDDVDNPPLHVLCRCACSYDPGFGGVDSEYA